MTKISVINQPRYEASVDQWVRNIKNAAIKIVNEVVSEEVVPPRQWPKVGLKATKSLVKKSSLFTPSIKHKYNRLATSQAALMVPPLNIG